MLRSLVLVSLSLLTLVTASRADAKCMSTAEWLVTEQVAGPSPSIVVAVYAMSKTRPTITFELVGPKGERIALRETARHNGWRTDHVVYVPTKPLTPGTYDVVGAPAVVSRGLAQRDSFALGADQLEGDRRSGLGHRIDRHDDRRGRARDLFGHEPLRCAHALGVGARRGHEGQERETHEH